MTATVERPTGAAPATTTTIVTRVRDRAAATPTAVAMRSKELGLWRETSWAEYWDEVQDVAHALLALGVRRGDRVAIQSENRREWLTTDLGAVAIGAVTVGLYPTNPAAEVVHVLADSGAVVLLAEDQEQLDKALEVGDRTPELRSIVYVEPRGIRGRYRDPRLLHWAEFRARGREHRAAHPGAVEEAMAATRPGDLMTLIYTSGTTGLPKGAMLTVANVEATIGALTGAGGLLDPPAGARDLALSYLPLCHVAERIFTTWNNAATGIQVNFAESIDTVPANLREIQPTFFFAVPRIWEKLLATVQVRQAAASPMKGAIGRVGMKLAAQVGETLARTGGRHTAGSRVRYGLAWVLVVRALRERLGLRRVRWAGCGAAPVSLDVLQFFLGLGVPVYEVYGMTENTASATANRPGTWRLGTVGVAHDSVELRVDERTGEILTRGPATFAGYWNRPDATAEAVDADGWLHTGDVGTLDDDGFLRITDRMKDIMITAGGKNIAPSEIENALKVSPYVKEAVLIGDRRPYLTALIGIEPDTVGDWAQQQRIPFTTYRDLTEKKEVLELVQGIVTDVNSRLATVEQVKAFRLLPKMLDHEDGELTATQKVRRAAMAERFSGLVDSMYRGAR
ncbi:MULTISPECIES: AMP-dependent synthetase/ligase [unclassified Geodermatophilus]|uniref:AMP-dependent synthetase/ligase n=1 Tax=unclassified Geodermatophilus TaxID=2637632 RepID=UPI003EED90AE